MNFKFLKSLPDYAVQKPILISGKQSVMFSETEYLSIEQNDIVTFYEIKYEYHCSPFRDVMIESNVLTVGFEEHFYLFDLINEKNILSLKMNGYFGHLYFYENLFYVADACGIHCVDANGTIIWQNPNLGLLRVQHYQQPTNLRMQ